MFSHFLVMSDQDCVLAGHVSFREKKKRSFSALEMLSKYAANNARSILKHLCVEEENGEDV